MMSEFRRSLFVFRRDLRIEDNTALMKAIDSSQKVIPCFIFDPRLANPERENFNDNAFQFLLESLEDLRSQLESKGGRLYMFSGMPEDVIGMLADEIGIDAVFLNEDYTPFSRQRDESIRNVCNNMNVRLLQFHDCLLNEPATVFTQKGKPYSVFSQFYHAASANLVPVPSTMVESNFYTEDLGLEEITDIDRLLNVRNDCIFTHGGRYNALKVLENISRFKDYDYERDYPSVNGTTGLSAHNKLGTISIREFYHIVKDELGAGHSLIRELYWRDFFTYIAYHYPYVFKCAFKEKFEKISWDYNMPAFGEWCSGNTGFPIVDAGMRELNSTGYMHNRVRMIVASFLVKDLHLDWRWGERYFASKLVDYDPCVNNGNWQWAASTGADSQPFFRIFNPWLQQRKYDPQCEYIKKWVPELAGVNPKIIHALEKTELPDDTGYRQPMVDHSLERARSLVIFRSV
ncbi:deoxyribodipyrimidine photo-lyase [Methanolobus sp. ZRKC2]|uniref:cryptochrome/photolyase family protein n=1 Tax=Methanolobus sp. ZRKC2 TaxID=3125783 RepID=UPI00324EDAC9